MKKILMLFLLTASLGFSANYKVEVKPNVKIQQSEIEKNNLEIEKVFLENTKRDTLEGIKEVDNQIAEQKDELGARFFGEILKEYMRNMEYRIKEINYNSNSSADLKFVLKAPKLNFNSLLGAEDQEKINKTFEQKTGKSIKYLSNVSGEDFQKKWMPTLIDIISKTVSDNIKDIMISAELKQRIDSILFEIKLINKLYSELLIEKSKNLLGLKYKNLIFFDSSETNFSYGTVKE